MERSSDHNDLATALAEVRTAPRETFTRELDERAAAGFPRRSRLDRPPLAGFAAWARTLSPRRLLLAGTVALVVIAVTTVAMTSGNSSPSDSQSSSGTLSLLAPAETGDSSDSEVAPPAVSPSPAESSAGESASAVPRLDNPTYERAGAEPFRPESLSPRHRDIERSADIGLLADPADVADDSAAVFAAVHDAHGIVLHSTTTSGKRAGADFDLLIPSARLGDALAAFSAIDEVGARHEATDDITAPTVTAGEELRYSRARIDGLLAQLSSAESETEMATIEAELARERHRAARLRAQVEKLEQRAEFSRVSVRIKTSGSSSDSGGSWGIGDAFGDAGHILGIVAGVTLIGLAVLAPLALIALLAWFAHRAWVSTQRKRALRNP
jgi:hypothetical protein